MNPWPKEATGEPCTIRAGRPEDARTLSDLAIRSKGIWGYAAEFLDACRDELTYDRDYLATHPVFVLENPAGIAGFCSLERLSDNDMELGSLFVGPGQIGKGYGRALVEHASKVARAQGAVRIVIHGDPNAADFYLAMGARCVGEVPSASIAGRMLPLFYLDLEPG